MAETPKNTLKQWFVTGAKPLQAQYWAWLESYWHKSEAISINAIDGLGEILEGKADADQLQHYALLDASNIGVNQGAWRTALGINDITPPDVDLTNYYTKPEVDSLLEDVTVDLSNYYTAAQTEFAITSKGYITSAALTGYATENWVSTQTTPATQAESEASTGTESQPLSAEPTTENRKFLSLFNFFKLIKKLRYIHLLPNSATATANRLRSDGSKLFFANQSAVEKEIAYVNDVTTLLQQPIKTISANTTLDNSYHNAIVRVTATCTITVPSTLRADFNAVFEAIGNISATFLEDTNTVFSAPFGKLLKDNSMCNLYKYNATTYRLNGGLLPV